MGRKPVVTFRKTTEQDAPLIIKWLKQKDVLKGFCMTNEREIQDAVKVWMLYLKKGASITAIYKKEPCGAANLYINEIEKMKHQSLFVIIVDEKRRGQGIGTLLIKEIMRMAKTQFNVELLHLEVYEDNPACRLYKRLGFEKYGHHHNYIKDERGIYYSKVLMQKKL